MIRWINHLSLATKLRLVIVYAAGAALLVASGLYITGEVLGLRSLELMLVSLFLAGLVAYFLAARLQRLICVPINELLVVARNVRTTQTFTLRARKHNDDEMGALVDGFNSMLARAREAGT